MVTKVFSGVRLVISMAVIVLTAEVAHAALPPIRPPLPPVGGPHIGRPFISRPFIAHPFISRPLPHAGVALYGRPFFHPGYHVPHPYYLPHNAGYGGSFFYSGYSYAPYYGGYGVNYSSYEHPYAPSYSNYGSALTTPVNDAATTEEKDVAALLAASGVPTDGGRPVWPLALRILPGGEAQALRVQIDALLEVAATGAARGDANTAAGAELSQATDRLRKLLLRHREERGSMASASYEEAGRFLDKLAGVQKLLR